MNKQASLTALMSAFGRAYHSESQNPIFEDRAVKSLMSEEEYNKIGDYIVSGLPFFAPEKLGSFSSKAETLDYLVNTQIAPTPVARARFCEDCLKTAMQTGTAQYVILGAGLDTFAFRNKEFLKKHQIFEVDHPLTQEDKIRRIRSANWEIPQGLHFVPVDFAKDNLAEALLNAGFERNKKTFFSWLGVSYYLSKEEIGKTLQKITEIACSGSSLLFDFGDENLFSAKERRVNNMLAMAAAGGEKMKSCFSYEELEMLMDRYGFLIYEWMTAKDIERKYFAGRKDGLHAFEHISYANVAKMF